MDCKVKRFFNDMYNMTKTILRLMSVAIMLGYMVSCTESDPEIEPPVIDDPEEVVDTEDPNDTDETDDSQEPVGMAFDLSAEEAANCYIVQAPGKYKFMADNQFNLGEGLPVPPVINPAGIKLVWQTVPGSISSVELTEENGKIFVVFDVEKAEGNAVIAVLDEEGEIEWSWHIWMPLEEVGFVTDSDGNQIMNLNLGALNNTPGDPASYGTLYQWGRKDPFPAAGTLTGTTTTVSANMYDINGKPVTIKNSSWTSVADNTLDYSRANPTICLSNMAQYEVSRDWLRTDMADDTLWGSHSGLKTCYDPCPPGWKVPHAGIFAGFIFSGTFVMDVDDFNIADINSDGVCDINDYQYGWHFIIDDSNSLYFPAAARFDGQYAMLMGSVSGIWGNYWSCMPGSRMAGGANCALAFQVVDEDVMTLSTSAEASRADAYSIRPVRTH